MMKPCCTCHQMKTLSNFCNNKQAADGLSAQCRACAKKYRETHKEEKKGYPSSTPEYRTAYINDNREHTNELRRKRWKKNPEPYRKQGRESHARNRDKRLAAQRIYYRDNFDHIRNRNRIWSKNNKERIYLSNRKRVKQLKGVNITQNQVNDLLMQNGNKCAYCSIIVKSGVNLHMDHIIPLCRGGAHSIENLAPACATCNLKKGRMTAEEFMARRAYEAQGGI